MHCPCEDLSNHELDPFSSSSKKLIIKEDEIVFEHPIEVKDEISAAEMIQKIMDSSKVIVLFDLQSGQTFIYKASDLKILKTKILGRLSFFYSMIFRAGRLPINQIIDARSGLKKEEILKDVCKN